MGYGQKASGTIKIAPPVTAAELREYPGFTDERDNEIYLVTERVITETEDGEIARIRASEIAVSSPDEEFSRYHIEEQLQEIVTTFHERTYEGHIVLAGEDGEQSALIVENGQAKTVRPRVVWPWDKT